MHLKERHIVIHSPVLRPSDYLRFIHIEPFPARWTALKLTDDDLRFLEIAIMSDPERPNVIPGGNGLRKIRLRKKAGNQGKSGGYRAYYVHFPEYGMVLLLAILDKRDKADLPRADVHALAVVITRVKTLLERGVIR